MFTLTPFSAINHICYFINAQPPSMHSLHQCTASINAQLLLIMPRVQLNCQAQERHISTCAVALLILVAHICTLSSSCWLKFMASGWGCQGQIPPKLSSGPTLVGAPVTYVSHPACLSLCGAYDGCVCCLS